MARLIDGGPDRIELFPEVLGEDDDGNPERKPSTTPIVVQAQLHRLSSEESAALGQTSSSLYYFNTAKALPLGAYAGAKINGRRGTVVGEPTRQGRSPRTAHTHVVVRITEPVI